MLIRVGERPGLWIMHWDSRYSLDNIKKGTGQLSGMSEYGEYSGVFLGYYGGA